MVLVISITIEKKLNGGEEAIHWCWRDSIKQKKRVHGKPGPLYSKDF